MVRTSGRLPRLLRSVTWTCAALTVLVITAACGSGASRPVRAPAPAPVLSNYEHATGNTIPRDCGYSSPLPGKPGWSLWLFCDTAITGAHSRRIEQLILGTDTAAAGPYRAGQVPGRLSEIATPPAPLTVPGDGAPQPFLPAPQQLLLPDTMLPCGGPGAYAASWITGVSPDPAAASSPDLLISYDDYCVMEEGDSLTPEGFGLVAYDPVSNLLSPPDRVFSSVAGLPLSPQQTLGSPVVRDGYLYLYSFCRAGTMSATTGGCGRGRVFLARTLAQPASWQNPLSYQYWTGRGWSPDQLAAASVISTGAAGSRGRPLGISVGNYGAIGHGLVMIEQTSLAGGFQVWQAMSPAGPWRLVRGGQVPCRPSTEARTEASTEARTGARTEARTEASTGTGQAGGADSLCRALIGHPELSTRSQLLISYFDPGNDHVDVSAYRW